MERRAFAFDTETGLIEENVKAPPLVCVSYADDAVVGLLHHSNCESTVRGWLEDDSIVLVGANIAYDMGVLMQRFPDLTPLIWRAYDDDRVDDVQIRERLYDIGRGVYWQTRTQRGTYSLAGLAKRHYGEIMEKDEWRLRYMEFHDVPVHEWPEGAVKYAKDDAVMTYNVYEKQTADYGIDGYLVDSFRQTRAAWWLHLMSAWGICTDQARVAKLAEVTRAEYDRLEESLLASGLMKRVGKVAVRVTRDTKAAKQKMVDVVGEANVKTTAKGQIALSREACEDSGDEDLGEYAEISHLKTLLSKEIPALQPEVHSSFEVLMETGRTSSTRPNIQNPSRKGGIRECFAPRPGYVFVDSDYDIIELRTFAQVCLNKVGESRLAEKLNGGFDPHLDLGAQLLGISYERAQAEKKSAEVKNARQMAKCFHPDVEVLTRQGWVKISEVSANEELATPTVLPDGKVHMTWAKPLRLTSRESPGELVHLHNEGIDLRVTPDHRMAGYRQRQDGSLVPDIFMPEELDSARYWPNAGVLADDAKSWSTDERLLRLAVATQADGSYQGKHIRLGFTKARKIERLRTLLNDGEYTEKTGAQNITTFRLTAEVSEKIRSLLEGKAFPWRWLSLTEAQRRIVLEEAQFWDGSSTGAQTQYQYSSASKQCVDVLQAIASITNRKTRLHVDDVNHRKNPSHSVIHNLSVKLRNKSRGGSLSTSRISHDGEVFCVTTHTDYILVRDGGIPVITHQCANFGFPGGMGPKRFSAWAKASYGLDMTESAAGELRDNWFQNWPEAKKYFEFINKELKWYLGEDMETKRTAITQIGSLRIRGGASFTEACNGFFQGLAADIGKNAGFLIARACYDESAKSPLYGSRIVNFIHDQFIVEVPEEIGHECAMEVGKLMREGAEPFIPDVPATCTPCLATCWSKEAEAVYDSNGRLIPWKPKD